MTVAQDNLCSQISTLIESSKTGFVSMVGAAVDEEQRSYVSKLELSGWTDGFVHPEADGPYVLYVSLGGNDLSKVKKRYKVWIRKLTACLRGWKRYEVASEEEVKSRFLQTAEGPIIEVDYNVEPSTVGDTKYDLYLTFMAPLNVVEKNFCGDLSSVIDASRNGFASIVGAKDGENGGYTSTLKLAVWGSGWVYPEADAPHALYIIIGGNRISQVRHDYERWASKLTMCLPGWKRREAAFAEEVMTVFSGTGEGPSIELEYNRKPSKVGSTKYDLYLTIQTSRAPQK